jgi:hypothetical protein
MTAEVVIRVSAGGSAAPWHAAVLRLRANEAPRRRALLVALDDCNASYVSTPSDKAPVS